MACINIDQLKASLNNSGFTLVELIVVILLIGILSITVAPRFFTSNIYAERGAVDDLMSALRYTQQLAMNRGGGIRLVLAANGYTVELTSGVQLRSPDGRFPYTKNFPSGVSATPNTVEYNGLGQPVPNATSTLTVGSSTITIEAETGYAHQ